MVHGNEDPSGSDTSPGDQSCSAAATEEEIGRCVCGSDALDSMATCGACFHADSDVSGELLRVLARLSLPQLTAALPPSHSLFPRNIDISQLCQQALEGGGGRIEVLLAASAFALVGAVGVIWLA
jgi:hypothetical protein